MDDQIDFPVSDDWRDHYAAQGLTYPSGRHERTVERALADLEKDARQLGEILQELRDQLSKRPPPLAPSQPISVESGFTPILR